MNDKTRVLVIEDDEPIRAMVSEALVGNDYEVAAAQTGTEGLHLAHSLCPDVILLDLGLPDIDGSDVLQQIRCQSSVPVIVVSARDQVSDKVSLLDMGADDYVTKPFDTEELMARIRTSLQHYRKPPKSIYRSLDLEIDYEKRLICLEGRQVHLTKIEYQLLNLLSENAGRVLTYPFIMEEVWGPYIDNSNQILRVNMANIRRKIERNTAQPQYVFTEVGVGYRMRENEYAL